MGHAPLAETPPLLGKQRRDLVESPCEFNLNAKLCESPASGSSSAEEDGLLVHIWSEVDEFVNGPREPAVYDSDDDEECFALRRKQEPVVGRMPCGDLHVCRLGKPCPFLEANEDRVMVCMYTGLQHGPEQTDEFFDLNGGNGKRSGDPDQNCGELVHGKWSKRCDPLQASRMAFEMSTSISNDEVIGFVADARAPKRVPKRGARCVGEEEEEVPGTKRARCSKKNVSNSETVSHLHSEAALVITKMIDHKKASSFKSKQSSGKPDRKCAPTDPRMADQNFVFQASLKRYLKNCTMSSTAPSLDAIHNLSLAAAEVSRRAKQQQQANEDTDGIRTAKFRSLCSSLVVALWAASCKSPYMANARRGTDAYRPFVCGVLYGFKRGIQLSCGTVLVPRCPQLADSLPVLRGTGGNTMAKTLHSS